MCCFLTWPVCFLRSWAFSLVSLPLASLIFMVFIWSYRKKEQHGKSRQRKLKLLQWNKKSSQQLFLRWILHSGRQRHNILVPPARKGDVLFAALAYFSKLPSFSVCTCFHNIPSLGSQMRPFSHPIPIILRVLKEDLPHGAKQISTIAPFPFISFIWKVDLCLRNQMGNSWPQLLRFYLWVLN